jgi:hypothetical protein
MGRARSGLGRAPMMTPDILRELYGEDYRAGEYYIESQKSGQDLPPDQPRVPSLQLEEITCAKVTSAVKGGDDSRLASAREHKPLASAGQSSSADQSSGTNSGPPKIFSARTAIKKGLVKLSARGVLSLSKKDSEQDAAKNVLPSQRTGDASVSERSAGGSQSDNLVQEEMNDEQKLVKALFDHSKQEHVTKYSKTEQFYSALPEGQPLAEVGVNLPQIIKILIGMKVINTAKSTEIGKRDVLGIGR